MKVSFNSSFITCVAFLAADALHFAARNPRELGPDWESMDKDCESVNNVWDWQSKYRSVWDVSAEVRENHTLTVRCFIGRTGNNLVQLAHMLFLAETQGATELIVGKPSPYLQVLLRLPGRVPIHADPEFRSRVRCSPRHMDYFIVKCDGVQRSDYTRVFRQYLLPHLTKEVQERCEAQKSNTDRELVLHLRARGLLVSARRQSKFAPCAFFTKVARDFQFDHVHIITEPDLGHPCIEPLRQRYGTNATVSSGGLVEDVCALMHARHLALGALSTFAESLNRFSGQGVQFDAFGGCGEGRAVDPIALRNFGRSFDHKVLAAAEAPCKTLRSVRYCVEGIDRVRNERRSKFEWMLNYREDDVRRVANVCNNTDVLMDENWLLQPLEPH